MKMIALSVIGALVAGLAAAAVKTAEVEYRQGETVL